MSHPVPLPRPPRRVESAAARARRQVRRQRRLAIRAKRRPAWSNRTNSRSAGQVVAWWAACMVLLTMLLLFANHALHEASAAMQALGGH